MPRDKAERRHRRTWRNHNCVEMMARADFDAVPPLAEAMGLTDCDPARECEKDARDDEEAARTIEDAILEDAERTVLAEFAHVPEGQLGLEYETWCEQMAEALPPRECGDEPY